MLKRLNRYEQIFMMSKKFEIKEVKQEIERLKQEIYILNNQLMLAEYIISGSNKNRKV